MTYPSPDTSTTEAYWHNVLKDKTRKKQPICDAPPFMVVAFEPDVHVKKKLI